MAPHPVTDWCEGSSEGSPSTKFVKRISIDSIEAGTCHSQYVVRYDVAFIHIVEMVEHQTAVRIQGQLDPLVHELQHLIG